MSQRSRPPSRSGSTPRRKQTGWRAWVYRAVGGMLTIGLLGLLVVWSVLRSVPEFYRQRQANSALNQIDPKDELEAQVLEFRNQARGVGSWKGTFTEAAVNRWLTLDLPRKFSSSLPPGTERPLVALEANGLSVGMTTRTWLGKSVLWVAGEVARGTQPNSLAITVRQCKLGGWSIPLSLVERPVIRALSGLRITANWLDGPGGRILVLHLPALEVSPERVSQVENVQVESGTLTIVLTTRGRDRSR